MNRPRIVAAVLLVVAVGATQASCAKPALTVTATSTSASMSAITPALDLFGTAVAQDLTGLPDDVQAENVRVLIYRATAVVRELRRRPDADRVQEGIALGDAVSELSSLDRLDPANRQRIIDAARALDRWLRETVPGYPPTITPTIG
ncbi:hypothetical protein GCM10022243_43840 [Saccharothrix violaceirubra]|uniref:Uncharacterized protein n=1 Tax=Saccharothrix violaceirubra TaxID=413306 RepID=A0A7W7WWJ9_9PSEU|nr:hypothetical protein [Saccharothrix violaceirubra]MBB4965673.1 hypothetical protein [Saccharothrix violaceirubra]